MLLTRLLLAESGRRWQIADVAGRLGIGTEYAQRVVRRLARFGWLEASADDGNDGGAVTYHVLAASTLRATHLERLHPELTARYARLSGLVGSSL